MLFIMYKNAYNMCIYTMCALLPVTMLSAKKPQYAGFHLLGFLTRILKIYKGLFFPSSFITRSSKNVFKQEF